MDLIHLKSFYEVASLGSLTSASEKLNISQPALSRQISSLENQLEISLFSRHSRGVKLTEAGRRLYEYAQNVINQLEKAEKALAELKDLEAGSITIGASTTIGNYLLPLWISNFIKSHPKVDIILKVNNTKSIIEEVLDGKIDLGLVAGSINMPELCQEYITNDQILLLVEPNHRFTNEQSIFATQLNDEILIVREEGSATRKELEQFLENNEIHPKKIITFGDTEAVKRAVSAGIGITFLSQHTVQIELKCRLLYSPDNFKYQITRPLLAIYPKGARLSPATLSLLSTIKKEGTKLEMNEI